MLLYSLGFIFVFIFLVWLKIYLFSKINKIKKEAIFEAELRSTSLNLLLGGALLLIIIPFWISHQTTNLSFFLINLLIGIIYLFVLTFFEFIFIRKLLLDNTKNKKAFWTLFIINLLLGGMLISILLLITPIS